MSTSSSGKASRGLFTSFFVGEDGTQYFIKPLEFAGNEKNAEMHIDFTLRYRDNVSGESRLNSSIYTTDLIKEVDSIRFSNSSFSVTTQKAELMFNQRKSQNIESRHEVYLELADLKALFGTPDWEISVHYGGKERVFKAEKRTRKKISALNHDIFELF
ncbi:MAG: hypothetical protein ABR574_03885 [Cryomorphaceae bacterium]